MSTAELALRKTILDMLKDVDEDFVLDLINALTSSIVKKHKSKKSKEVHVEEDSVDESESPREELPEYFKNFKISPKVQAMILPNRVDFDYDKELEEALMEKYL